MRIGKNAQMRWNMIIGESINVIYNQFNFWSLLFSFFARTQAGTYVFVKCTFKINSESTEQSKVSNWSKYKGTVQRKIKATG
jgi:hypothetical protein